MKKSVAIVVCVLAGALLLAAPHARAVTVVEDTELRADDAEFGDFFGEGVALSGNTALVGARGVDDIDSNAGAVYVFTHEGGIWVQEAKLLASDGVEGDGFGVAVALDGGNALIGAGWADDVADQSGAAYVFTLDGNGWTEQAKLVASDGTDLAWFGFEVALQGDLAVIGAEGDDHSGNQSGAGYLFAREGGSWTERAKLSASDGAGGDRLGSAIAFAGNTVILGAYAHGHGLFASGSAYVYQLFGDDDVPATTIVGLALLLVTLLGTGVFFLRGSATN